MGGTASNANCELHHHDRHRVAMVCDFFYPSTGGVENHILQLAQCLLHLGHKVIVITHKYGDRNGVRWLAGGLKVYYVPISSVYDRCMMPTGFLLLPLLRDILVREHITTVHTHAVCTMSFEAITLAALMGYRVVHTEHSNFGFTSPLDIHLNKVEQFILCSADTAISVSHASKENLCLRCRLNPQEGFVIPNAVESTEFQPNPNVVRPKDSVNVVVLMRLVWRKGVHLLVRIVPDVCRRFPYVHFIIGGDGPRRAALEEMRERHHLQDRVELLGAVQHSDVPSVLTRGHVFLNTSLTEAFGIAILEAVSCGLTVVSTRVGGVPEILPAHMIHLTDPEPAAILEALSEVIPFAKKRPLAVNFHKDVSCMYSWLNVAKRTTRVYNALGMRPRLTLLQRFQTLRALGGLAGGIAVCSVAWHHLVLWLLRRWRPAEEIEVAPDFPRAKWTIKRVKHEPFPISSLQSRKP